jgi:hypothetical protein
MSQLFVYVDSTSGKLQATSSPPSAPPWAQEVPSGAVNSSNTSFTLANTPVASSSTFVYKDGLIVPNTLWSLTGSTITFTNAPNTGSDLYVVYIY